MADTLLPSSENFEDFTNILGLTPGYLEFLKVSLVGKKLLYKNVKDLGERMTISFTFGVKDKSTQAQKPAKNCCITQTCFFCGG